MSINIFFKLPGCRVVRAGNLLWVKESHPRVRCEERRLHWNFQDVLLAAEEMALPRGQGAKWSENVLAVILLKHREGEIQGIKLMSKGI